ncbi:MAG: RNA-guided endonuclease InsQ/TnpB family protein [bacterium]
MDQMIESAYLFRIYPNNEQKQKISEFARTYRFIYNYFLRQQKDIMDDLEEKGITDKDERKKYMIKNKLYFNKERANKILTNMAKQDEFFFLKEAPANMRHYALKDLDSAFKNMWKIGTKFPKFKNKFSKEVFKCQIQTKFNMILNNDKFGYLDIPKLKKITTSCHHDYFIKNHKDESKIKINSVTISRKGDAYYISVQVKTNEPRILKKRNNFKFYEDTTIGVDFGVTRLITTSNQLDFNKPLYNQNINLINQYQKDINKLSKILNRKRDYHKKIDSKAKYWETSSYQRIKNKIRRIYRKLNDVRTNTQYMVAHELLKSDQVQTIVLEDLKLKNMMKKSAKGKPNNKRGLNRSLGQIGLYSLRVKIENLAERMGKRVILVSPQNTSRRCSSCGHTHKDNRLTQSIFKCIECGFEANADYNAALNIKRKGLEKILQKEVV